jgi:hypothetical protein
MLIVPTMDFSRAIQIFTSASQIAGNVYELASPGAQSGQVGGVYPQGLTKT